MYTHHLVNELARLETNHEYVIVHHVRDRATLAPGPNFRRVNTLTPCHHRLERWSLALESARFGLDVLHSQDVIPPQHWGWRSLITIHDLHYLHFSHFMTADSLRYYKSQIAWAVQAADHILASSHNTRNDLCNLLDVDESKVSVHWLGVDDIFHPLPPAEIAAGRGRLGLPDEYLLFVGTYEPRKNIPGLLEAYHRLRQVRSDLPPLVLAGRRGWLYEDIFAKADELQLGDHLRWVEGAAQKDLPILYNGALLFVLPSHYEGFGLPVLEAMACGTPVVASDRSSLPEVAGDAGLLVDPDDPNSIAAAIGKLLDDSALCADLREKGLARARIFTWQGMTEQVLRVYESLAH